MRLHFTSFTPEAMYALGQELADDFQRRAEFLRHSREQTVAMLAKFREKEHERAWCEAEARRIFVSELKADIILLLERYALNRQEVAEALQEMARECRAAKIEWRNRPRPGSLRRHHLAEKHVKHVKHARGANAKPFLPVAERLKAISADANARPFRPAAANKERAKARSGHKHRQGQAKKRRR